MKKNLSIIPLHKCLLLAPKMFIVHWGTISAYFPLLSKQLGKYLKSFIPKDAIRLFGRLFHIGMSVHICEWH